MKNLLEWRLRDILLPPEAVFLDAAAATTPEAAYLLLDATSPAAQDKNTPLTEARRRLLLSLLRPFVPQPTLRDLRKSHWRRKHTGFGAFAANVAYQSSLILDITNLQPAARPTPLPQIPIPFTANDAAGWIIRNQEDQPTCVTQATVACIELMRRRATPPQTQPLSVRFLYNQSQQQNEIMPAAARTAGYTSLGQASQALANVGICLQATWPEAGPLNEPPSQAALDEAGRNRMNYAKYCDWRAAGKPTPGAARMVYDELTAHHPVAVVLPGLSNLGAPGIPTTWTRLSVVQTGVVSNPGPDDKIVPLSGHAVCIVGFQPDPTEPMGGWFIFRNSFGPFFGAHPAPMVPAPGYGIVSALTIESCTTELLSLPN